MSTSYSSSSTDKTAAASKSGPSTNTGVGATAAAAPVPCSSFSREGSHETLKQVQQDAAFAPQTDLGVHGKVGMGEREPKDDEIPKDVRPFRGTLESGTIYFFYRPKVEQEFPHDLTDVQGFFMLLLPGPSSKGKTQSFRMIRIGKKRLPEDDEHGKHEALWGVIESVGDDLDLLRASLKAFEYETKTQGHRHQPAARPAGRGHYTLHSPLFGPKVKPIERADINATRDFPVHLQYALSTPNEPGDVQEVLKINEEGGFIVQIKNPASALPFAAGPAAFQIPLAKQPKFPPRLAKYFTSRFIAPNPPQLLNYPGAELLFISAHASLTDNAQDEAQHPAEEERAHLGRKEVLAQVDKELGIRRDEFKVGALFGEWA